MEIGKLKLVFNMDGHLESVNIKNRVVTSMGKPAIEINTCEDEAEMIEKSKIVLSHWFSIVNSVELLDQSRYRISNVPYEVSRFADGRIKEIGIHFYVEEISAAN